MIILTYLPRRKNKRSKHIRIPGSPERRVFFVALDFGSKTRKFGRDQKIYIEPYFQVIYIYINIYTYFQGGAPASEYFILRCFQPTLGCNRPTNSAGADVLRLLGAMGPLTSLLSGEAHMGAMAVTERCIENTYPTRVKEKHVTPEEMWAQ